MWQISEFKIFCEYRPELTTKLANNMCRWETLGLDKRIVMTNIISGYMMEKSLMNG